MVNAKTIIITGIGALAALTIYGAASTKKASADGGRSNRLARIEALMNEGTAKYRPSFFRHAVKRHAVIERIAGLDPLKTVPVKTLTEVAAATPAKPDPTAEEAKKAAEKKAADEKKKKDDEAKKKKKKKKKKAGDTTPDESTSGDQVGNDDDEKKKVDPSAIATGGGGGLSNYMRNQVDPNKAPETIEEWITYLSVNSSIEKTSKFIQLAQVKSVKGEVFYPVCEKLLSLDSRLQEFSVMALGSVVNVTSLEYLANVAAEPTFAERLKNQASAYLNQYARVEYVRFAGEAAISKDSISANAAIQIIERALPSLRSFASAQSTSATTAAAATVATSTTSTARAPASTVAKIFESVLQNLTQASQTGVDSGVRSSAHVIADQTTSLLASLETSTAQSTAQN